MTSDHVKRGAERHTDRPVTYDGMADDAINSVWCCTECGDELEIRARPASGHAYVSVGCSCGTESLDLRIADLLEFKMESWDTVVAHKLGRSD